MKAKNANEKNGRTRLNAKAVEQTVKQITQLRKRGDKALKDLRVGFNKVVNDVKRTAEKVASDFS